MQAHAPRPGAAVGNQVEAELAAGGLDRRVDLTGRHLEALGDQLEVMNQRLHRGVQLVARRQGDLAVVRDDRTLGQAVERLLDQVERGAHLVDADAEARIDVARLFRDRRIAELAVAAVAAVGGAQVIRHARGAQVRPRHAHLDREVRRHHADADRTRKPNRVRADQLVVLVDLIAHEGDDLAAACLEALRQILGNAADLAVPRVHAGAAGHLEQVEHLVARTEAVEEQGDAAEVDGAGAEKHEVRVNARQLLEDHADPLGAARHLELEGLLRCHAERGLATEEGQVVHARHVRNRLPVRLLLDVLLDAGVDVADLALDADDDLAVERRHHAEHAVRRRVVRAEVDLEQVRVVGVRPELGRHGLQDVLLRPHDGLLLGRCHVRPRPRTGRARHRPGSPCAGDDRPSPPA